jgi:hypothetical protein
MDSINAVYGEIVAALDPVPLYNDAAELNRSRPEPPYALLEFVSSPADSSNRYRPAQSADIFSLAIRGPKYDLLQIEPRLEWLRSKTIGEYGNSKNLRYRRWTRTMPPEPGVFMPDDATPVYNLSITYRCELDSLAPFLEVVP